MSESNNDEVVLYDPGEELDPTSKMSYVRHISYRLGLEDPLEATKNGGMSSEQIATMANTSSRINGAYSSETHLIGEA